MRSLNEEVVYMYSSVLEAWYNSVDLDNCKYMRKRLSATNCNITDCSIFVNMVS